MSGTRELPDPLVGSVVAGRYRVERRLAAGGMGVVYEATQEPLGRRVALKVIRGEAVFDPVARARFEREAKTASSLQDPHVVVVHDFGVLKDDDNNDGGLFIAMEFVEGVTLREHLGNEGRLTWRRSLVVVEQVARALAAAHGKGLVHRDLKPENIMLVPTSGDGSTAGFFCKVLDFGLAKGIDDDLLKGEGQRLTRSGGFVGTPGYISPEHIDGASEDARQDVYALGVVWWEMLTGRHPFPAETPMKTLLRQMHEDPPTLDEVFRLADGVPSTGAELVREMMARTPRDRPRDGGSVLGRLLRLDAAPSSSASDIDSNAPTLAGEKRAATLPPAPPPSQPQASLPSSSAFPQKSPPSGTPTIDGRGPRVPGPTTTPPTEAPTTNSQTSTTPAPTTLSPPPSSSNVPRVRRTRRRLVLMLVGSSVVGTIGGGIAIKNFDTVDPPPDPPPVVVVDAGLAPLLTTVEVTGLTTFSSLKAVRDLLPAHTLKVYRPQRSELVVDGDVAGAVADRLEGKVVDVAGVLMTLDIKELDHGRLVVGVSAFVDAGVIVDGGVADAGSVVDAGVAVAPGGLEP